MLSFISITLAVLISFFTNASAISEPIIRSTSKKPIQTISTTSFQQKAYKLDDHKITLDLPQEFSQDLDSQGIILIEPSKILDEVFYIEILPREMSDKESVFNTIISLDDYTYYATNSDKFAQQMGCEIQAMCVFSKENITLSLKTCHGSAVDFDLKALCRSVQID